MSFVCLNVQNVYNTIYIVMIEGENNDGEKYKMDG